MLQELSGETAKKSLEFLQESFPYDDFRTSEREKDCEMFKIREVDKSLEALQKMWYHNYRDR
jgi:hypothetical protein